VLERHVGEDHGRVRSEDVGGVVAPAEPGLDHRGVDPGRGEGLEGHRRERLELGDGLLGRQPEPLRRGPDGLHRVREGTVGQGAAVDLDPLGPVLDVRREVGADPHPLAGQGGRRQPARRRLAVGAHHVQGRLGALGVTQGLQEQVDPLQAELHPQEVEPLDPGPGGGGALGAAHESPSSSARSAANSAA
jgi:hypothetical protein